LRLRASLRGALAATADPMRLNAILLRLRRRPASVTAGVAVLWLLLEAFAYHNAIWPRSVPWLHYADQGHYLDSALAWRHLDLTPAKHNYPPGYAMLGMLFVDLMPWQPFAIPDALCLIIAALLFQRMVARLFPGANAWLVAAPIVFVLATTRLHVLRDIWFMPWSTTAAVPLQLLALVLALRYRQAPAPGRAAVWAFSIGVLAGVRPVDAAILVAVTGVFVALPPWRGARSIALDAASAGAGFAAAAAPLAFLHLAAHGFSLGGYLQGSAGIGFEWRLLPLRWVLLVIDARPLTDESAGMAARIPWFVPGLAGLLYACLVRGPGRTAWRLVTAAIVLHVAVYLCYRDLEPGGIWRYYNVHYFKWIFPFLLLAAGLLAISLLRASTRLQAVLCLVAVLPFFCLRAEFRPLLHAALVKAGDGAALPAGFASIWDAAFLPIEGPRPALYLGDTALTDAQHSYSNVADFKLFPRGSGAMLLPLRPLPAQGLHLVAGPNTHIDYAQPAVFGAVRIVPAMPYFLHRGEDTAALPP
jgi:hypothetical protein